MSRPAAGRSPALPDSVPRNRLLHRPAHERPRYRLVCFHHAGAGAGAYTSWMREAPEDVEMLALRLPGRESRLDEAAYDDPAAALDDVLEILAPLAADEVPLALYGHSMGGVLAYEAYTALAAQGLPDPLFLATGATPAPHRHAVRPSRLPTGHGRQDLLDLLHRYEGTRPEVFDHPELLEIVLGVLEADLTLLDSYRPALPPEPVRCPVLAFSGTGDTMVDAGDIEAWRECAAGPFVHRTFDSGHFFAESHATALLCELDAWSRPAAGSVQSGR
ncbi:thioesterase II family protein [Streptomyces sp. JJ36]|uniref:thioesterase II family protein n=1 Tax=Streptomyces sp. JJ36 TaxID=2736645 RepID=UPI001F1F1A74|nr:alpha/beta fold hydrolase [Streptomyces sp. JJ36]MCF6525326.1 thioesterase [Streptomyces sp. JJ36]